MISMKDEKFRKVLDRIPVSDVGTALTSTLDSVRWFLGAPLPDRIPGGGRVLAVDDEPQNLEILGLYMEQIGVDMIVAADGRQALAQLELLATPGSLDLILLDRRMPVMDGIEFLRCVKADPVWKDIPVIMQSAAVECEEIAEAILAGAWFYLTKPFQMKEFTAAVTAGVAARRKRQQARIFS